MNTKSRSRNELEEMNSRLTKEIVRLKKKLSEISSSSDELGILKKQQVQLYNTLVSPHKKECKNRYTRIFNSMTNAFVSVTLEGYIVEYNTAFKKMLGYADEELTKLTYKDLTPVKWHEIEQRIVKEEVLPNGYSKMYEKEYVHKDGTIFPIELKTHLIKDKHGNPKEMWAIINDISERKSFENKIIKSEERYKLLFNGIADAVLVFDWDFNIIDCNNAAQQMYEYSYEEMLRLTPFEYIHPRYHDSFNKNHHYFRTGQICLIESLHVNKRGVNIPVELKSIIVNEENSCLILAVVRDISERKKAEDNILQQSERFEALLRTTTEGLIMADSFGNITMVNEAYLNMSGFTKDELLGMSIKELEIPESPQVFDRKLKEIVEKGWLKFEAKHVRKDGSLYDVQVSLSIDKIKEESIGFIRDITEQLKLKNALTESESRYRIIADYSHDWEVFRNKKGELVYSSPAFEKLSGYSNKDYLNGKIVMKNIIHPDDYEFSMSMFNKALKGEDIPNFEFRLVTKGSEIKHLTIAVQPVYTKKSDFIGFRASIKDITDRVNAFELLKGSENRLKELLSSVTDYVISVKIEKGCIISTNYGLGSLSVTGYSPKDFLNNKYLWYKIIDFRDRKRVKQNVLALLSGHDIKPFELRITHKDNSTRWIKITSVLRCKDYFFLDGFDLLISDITEQKEAEYAKLQNEQRLKTLNEASFEGLLSVENYLIVDANEQFRNMFYSLNNQHINCSIYELVDIESHSYIKNLFNCGTSNSYEFKARRFDGSYFFAEMRIRKILSETGYHHIVAIRDISERKEMESRIISASIEAEEHERNRISRDLHDGIGPTLSTIKYIFNWFAEIEDINKIRKNIEKGNLYIDNAIQSIREISNNISPKLLEDLGVFFALEDFINTISETYHIKIDFQFTENRRFSRIIELNLYRIIKELFNNTTKHAKATNIKLRINIIDIDQIISILYSDNGIGFDLNSIINKGMGSGLKNITQRVKVLNGNIDIDSSEGMGEIIFIDVPY